MRTSAHSHRAATLPEIEQQALSLLCLKCLCVCGKTKDTWNFTIIMIKESDKITLNKLHDMLPEILI